MIKTEKYFSLRSNKHVINDVIVDIMNIAEKSPPQKVTGVQRTSNKHDLHRSPHMKCIRKLCIDDCINLLYLYR
jgi:hypothetical protein